MAPPPAPNDAKIFQPGLKILQVWHPKQLSGAGGCGAAPVSAGRKHEPVDFFVRVLRTDTPALPPGKKSDFPKPQSTWCFYVKQLPAVLGNAGPSRPHLRGGPSACRPGDGGLPTHTAPRRPGMAAAHVGLCLAARASWAADEGGRVLERVGLRPRGLWLRWGEPPPVLLPWMLCACPGIPPPRPVVTSVLARRPAGRGAARGRLPQHQPCFTPNPLSLAALLPSTSQTWTSPGASQPSLCAGGGAGYHRGVETLSGGCWGGGEPPKKPQLETVFLGNWPRRPWQGGGAGEGGLGCPPGTCAACPGRGGTLLEPGRQSHSACH